MNPFIKPIDPASDSPRVRVMHELNERPGQTMAQLAESLDLAYSTIRSCLRTLRNEGKARQRASIIKANTRWEAGRDDAYLLQFERAAVEPAPFVAFRHPLDIAFFGPAKQKPEGEQNAQ